MILKLRCVSAASEESAGVSTADSQLRTARLLNSMREDGWGIRSCALEKHERIHSKPSMLDQNRICISATGG